MEASRQALIVRTQAPGLSWPEGTTEPPITRIVDTLIESAHACRASDIHLEPQAHALFARFRIDGALQTIHEFPKSATAAIVSRVKIMANMDIAEKRLPQDGQIRTLVRDHALDLRISTLPAKYGEKVVIRLLDKSVAALDLGQLGMDPKTQSQFEMLIAKPQGLILVTGPTGSGKTTTLFSVLKWLRTPMKNIITLEDPIEYELLAENSDDAGVTQVQLHPKIGLTFASSLRASLRQDPDIIMVGEIRDQETAEVAMQASLTGHLVLSTVHTNSACDTVERLRDIGVPAYLIASTVIGVMAQRLVRVLCESCKEPYQLPSRTLKGLFPEKVPDKAGTFFRPNGCPACNGIGYRGRRGIYELLTMNDALKNLIHEQAPVEELRKLVQAQGLKTLRQSGLELVCSGRTSVEEVFRHTVE